MSFPQGVNFRTTGPYVTDGPFEDHELTANPPDYPFTTAQGNSIGYESTNFGIGLQTRNRNSGNDRRLAGMHWNSSTADQVRFRIDLNAANPHLIGLGAGDANYSTTSKVELFDGLSSLGVLCNGSTGAANSFFDATGAIYTAANWPNSQTLVQKTFTGTILRVIADGTNQMLISHLFVAEVPGLLNAKNSIGALNSSTSQNAVLDTNGATLLIAAVGTCLGTDAKDATIHDSLGNTWTWFGTSAVDGFDASVALFWCRPTSVGGGHTFYATHAGVNPFPGIAVAAFVGINGNPETIHAEAFNTATSLAAGSITPTANGDLILSGLCTRAAEGSNPTPNSSFRNPAPAQYSGGASVNLGFLIQGTAAAVNPTWSWTNAVNAAATNRAMKAVLASANPMRTISGGIPSSFNRDRHTLR